MSPILSADNLSLGFGPVDIIHHISFSVPKGTFVGILGPNGSGKTTLLKGISRALPPRTGTVHLNGKDLHSYKNRVFAQHVAYISQDISTSFDFSARDVVLMGRNPYMKRLHAPGHDDYHISTKALETVGIIDLADRAITEISGGERQRVFIARALAQEPDLLLLDEATSHLDICHEIEILSVIKEKVAHEKMTVLGVFHNLNSASLFCDSLILLKDGNIVCSGTPTQVLNAKTIHDVFGLSVLTSFHPVSGTPVVLPVHQKKEYVIHTLSLLLICGGGTGSLLMHLLKSEGYPLSCGILCQGDQDLRSADQFFLPSVRAEPFSQASDDCIEQLRHSVTGSEAVIVTKMPIGNGNLANISVLLENHSAQVIFFDPDPGSFSFSGYDFTSGRADSIIQTLCSQGALVVHSVPELLVCLQELEREKTCRDQLIF